VVLDKVVTQVVLLELLIIMLYLQALAWLQECQATQEQPQAVVVA
jgi:hypothetical protein